MKRKILVSAGEASGDLYASLVVGELGRTLSDLDCFGCTGPRLRAQGVRTVVDSADLAVVGILEVVGHLPRVWGEYRKLITAARAEKPDLALLTDSPDFHLRVARRLAAEAVPVVYLVAPQAWAWRKGRVKALRRTVTRLLCIFPFEEPFFRAAGVNADYIGHPLVGVVKPSLSRDDFFRKHGFDPARPLISVLPGSRRGEAARHMPALVEAVRLLDREQALNFVLPASATTGARFFEQQVENTPLRVIEGESWDAMAHSALALAASGTVTVEAALLGVPMVTFYRVNAVSWLLGRLLVQVPYYTMVNLIAGRQVVPELMQREMKGERIAGEALRLLRDSGERARMLQGLEDVRARLADGRTGAAPQRAAAIIQDILEGQVAHVS